MKTTIDRAVGILKAAGIRQSQQRIAILCYLMTHETHPDAEAIYNALHPDYPTMSLATVYNTVKALAEARAIRTLVIDKDTIRYDFTTTPHSHFRCRHCGKIVDLPLTLTDMRIGRQEFHIETIDVFYQGLCKDCYKQE